MKNNNFAVKKDSGGLIKEMSFGEAYAAVNESLLVYTDAGAVRFEGKAEEGVKYVCEAGFLTLTLQYMPVNGFSERILTLECKQKLRIFKIEKILVFSDKPEQLIDYKTFRYASACAFIRFGKYGIFTGLANPYFDTVIKDGNTVVQSFSPSLILNEGEKFMFDCDFTGIYIPTNRFVAERTPRSPLGDKQSGYMTRYHNPCAAISLDTAEIRAFQNYVKHWLSPALKEFVFEFYMYFSPVKPQPQTEEDETEYRRYIDNFVSLGGNLIVFQPLQRQTSPSPDGNAYWEVYKENSIAKRIADYAVGKGLKYGIYMGSAQDNRDYCNSPMNPYADKFKKPEWKKTDSYGTVSDENCIASDEFADWYFKVQKNTIEKFGLSFWCWDPGLGNGHFCYNESHGHIAGKGAYKGFKNTQRIIQSLKELNGGVYMQAFHGMKEYGVWGMKCFDQHEAYWEQDPGFFATMYSDFSADRITANGMRLQAWWNQNFRFLPASINHSLTHRMIQNCCDPKDYLKHIFDFTGYEFSLLSAIATGASITSPIVPYHLSSEHMSGYKEFYAEWLDWAKSNFEYLKNGVAFLSQPEGVTVDGYARLIGDKGFIFLCNGNPLKCTAKFTLDEDIGFCGDGKYSFKILYPDKALFADGNGRRIFDYGDEVCATVDEYTVLVLEIIPESKERLFGIAGSFALENGRLDITAEKQASGAVRKLVFDCRKDTVERLTVNGTEIPFEVKGGMLEALIRFGDKSDIYLGEWKCNGKSTPLPCGGFGGELTSEFYLSESVEKALKDFADTAYLSDYANEFGNCANGYYAWSLPDRLFLVLACTDAEEVEINKITVNGKAVEIREFSCWAITSMKRACYFADVTGVALFGAKNNVSVWVKKTGNDKFLGAFLAYPKLAKSSTISKPEVFDVFETAPLSSNPPLIKSDTENGGVKITGARLSGDFCEHTKVKLGVKLSKPNGEIAKVLCSCPITIDGYSKLTMNTDRQLSYSAEAGEWEVTFIVGERRMLIIDDDVIHIRAIDKNGFADDYVLPLNWKF